MPYFDKDDCYEMHMDDDSFNFFYGPQQPQVVHDMTK
jgi:hypothetical protein